MSLQGILLVLASAICHSAWNVLSKTGKCPINFLMRALFYSAICYFPLFLFLQFKVHYSPQYLICLGFSGLFTGLYFFSLAKAYQHGQVSIAYPVARTFPILVVTWAGLFLGEKPQALALVGIFLIISGCFVLPLKRFCLGEDGFALKNYVNWSCFWALLAAVFTSLFSMVDKVAASLSADFPLDVRLYTQINYVYLQNAISWFVIANLARLIKLQPMQGEKKRLIICGLIFLVSYSLIMIALINNPVAYVVSFRQLSIVIAALVSMIWIERSFSRPRTVGVFLIFCGVVLVGLS